MYEHHVRTPARYMCGPCIICYDIDADAIHLSVNGALRAWRSDG